MARLAAGAVLVAGMAASVLAVRDVSLPGHRGARRLVTGFVAGRWDARFLVARGPAAVHLPPAALQVSLTLSGPATVEAKGDAGAVSRTFGDEPQAWTLDLPRGGRVDLTGDGTVRLHALRLTRTGGASLSFAALVVRAFWDRARPILVLAALLAGLVAAAAAGVKARAAVPSRLPIAFAGVVLASCLAQVLLLPQPLIIGDPGAYYDMAGRFREALRAPLAVGESLHDLRPYAGLAFTATLYGALRAFRDAPSTIYVAHAFAMSGAVFFLVRAAFRAGRRRLALIVGGLAATYATWPVICGIVQPEPFILLAWCFAFDRVVAFADEGGPRRLVPAGLAFGLGLALHPQGIWYLLAAALLLLAPFALALRRPAVRHALVAFALGLVPVLLATSAGERYARPAVHVLDERYGFFAYTAPHPLGFWLFLETDGWQSAVRLDQTRYGHAFAAEQDAGRIQDGADAWGFTLRFIASEAEASLRAVLRNLHRLYRRPDNPFHRSWLMPYGVQVPWHQALVVAFLLGVPRLLRGREWPAVLPVAMLAATYPLYHIFNKYAVPGTPFVLFGAGVFAVHLLETRPRVLAAALLAAAIGGWTAPATLVSAGVPVVMARWGLLALLMGGLALAFTGAARGAEAVPRSGAVVAGLACLLALAGSAWDDPGWRAFYTSAAAAPRQEIVLDRAAMPIVEGARESYLAFDLQLDDGDPSDLRLAFGTGLEIAGSELLPTMPPFGLATLRGGRDPRRFAQWWILPWRTGMSADGRVAVTLHGAAGSRLGGDVGVDPPGTYHGLSLAHWPHFSVYRLMHEGEYRLPVHQPTEPSRRVGLYRIRIVALDDDAGGATWTTAPAPSGEIVTAVWARAGRAARAEIETQSGVVGFELGGGGPWTGTGGELRHAPGGEYEGWYLLRTRVIEPGAVTLTVRPQQQMTAARKYFLPEHRAAPPLPAEWSTLPFVPAAEIVSAREAPSWRPVGVF
jgi:hypothetical protein